MLLLIFDTEADLDAKDNAGKSPLYYSSLQDSKKLFNSLRQLGVKALPAMPTR